MFLLPSLRLSLIITWRSSFLKPIFWLKEPWYSPSNEWSEVPRSCVSRIAPLISTLSGYSHLKSLLVCRLVPTAFDLASSNWSSLAFLFFPNSLSLSTVSRFVSSSACVLETKFGKRGKSLNPCTRVSAASLSGRLRVTASSSDILLPLSMNLRYSTVFICPFSIARSRGVFPS